jgi:hypothetical protein
MAADVPPKHGGKRPGAGRPLAHGLIAYRRSLARLGTTKLDQRTTVAIGVKRFMAEVVRDPGGYPSAQQTRRCACLSRRDCAGGWGR